MSISALSLRLALLLFCVIGSTVVVDGRLHLESRSSFTAVGSTPGSILCEGRLLASRLVDAFSVIRYTILKWTVIGFSARQKNLAAASLVPVGLRVVRPVFGESNSS